MCNGILALRGGQPAVVVIGFIVLFVLTLSGLGEEKTFRLIVAAIAAAVAIMEGLEAHQMKKQEYYVFAALWAAFAVYQVLVLSLR